MSVRVSVVIPTYRRDDLLSQCLACLRQQTLNVSEYEIIVADDAPSASTAAIVYALEMQGGPRIKYVPVTATQGPAGARNAGWRQAQGAVIAFTDDDTQPDAKWLEAGLNAIAAADAVTGKTVVPLPLHPTDYERNTAGLAVAEFITANCFVRRSALEEVGGFDERFELAWREDSDLHFSLLSHGKRIIREDRAIVVHPVRPAPWGASLRQQHCGLFDPLLFRKHPKLYRERIPRYPAWYYVAVTGLTIGLAGLMLGYWAAALAGLATWLGVTGLLTARRLKNTSRAPSHVVEMIVTSAAIPLLSIYWRIRGLSRFRTLYFT